MLNFAGFVKGVRPIHVRFYPSSSTLDAAGFVTADLAFLRFLWCSGLYKPDVQ